MPSPKEDLVARRLILPVSQWATCSTISMRATRTRPSGSSTATRPPKPTSGSTARDLEEDLADERAVNEEMQAASRSIEALVSWGLKAGADFQDVRPHIDPETDERFREAVLEGRL